MALSQTKSYVANSWNTGASSSGTGVYPSMDMHLVRADGMQPLYWLLLAAKHELALRLWKAAANRRGQKELGLVGGGAA